MSRLLIVTADDVGLHPGMTAGALEAHEHGVVTACSVVACGRDFARAARLVSERRSLAAGVHLTLVGARPLSPPAEIRSLVGANGSLLPGFGAFLRRYFAGGIDPGEVERELRRQIVALLDAGVHVCHANGHQHLHVLPKIREVVMALAAEHGLAYVRTPVDRQPGGVPLGRRLAVGVLSRFGRAALRRAGAARSPRVGDATIGIARAGHLSSARIAELLPAVQGVTELVCHPGLDGSAIAEEFPWGYEWETETRALCDPAVAEAVRTAGITLVSPSELAVT